ncbi:solute carrier organic anion transporter family member 2A1 isoform X2 [Pimephales promelas]|uniref:solute carrier organic anion transporter family member 2A1 isoform X2 n=1 Tax=Pimephales promelas TaxID=90988 RepID=UPI00195587EB|nr:solute carrier organic anion transporter family member 2A1 isoform X2 [Pimephales promelas]KAG1940849.1 solute carrier organic anion transporter family member 2B1 [Pimephales promelas]
MDIYAKDIKKPKPALFSNIKFFVLCHGLLQLTQLLYSSYFKSTITTIERRYGLDSLSSGTVSSLHEVGNTVLIVFVSYMGSRVHRPLFIGLGGLLMSISAMILALPHFLSQPYVYDSVLHASRHEMCDVRVNATGAESCGLEDSRKLVETSKFWGVMATAQLLFGIGSVPIQPFGISYIDDFAGAGNSPLYIAILFALSVFGPSFGFLLGSVVLRIYVDVDRSSTGEAFELTPTDPRWVGAWWMGLLITAGGLALTSIPYFFFPRSLQAEKSFELEGDITKEDPKKPESSMLDFLKMFPKIFVRLLLSPLFMLLVLTQCCFSSVIAGLATFLNKFLERQYSATAAYSSLLIGALNLPAVAVGMVLGGLIMKRWVLSFRAIPRFSVVMLTISVFCCVPLFFMGCPTQDVAGVYPKTSNATNGLLLPCSANCSCPSSTFNPVCGENNIEYISPCHAGCKNYTMDPDKPHRIKIFRNCRCIPGMGIAKPGPCANSCPHYLLPAMLIISLAGLIASLTHNPIYMMVLRSVPSEEKSFAIGVQFLLLRVLTWLPAPALFGMTIDSTCLWWKTACGKKQGCGYYDNNLLRNRYLGLQVGYKALGIALMAFIGWKMHRTREYSLEKKPEGPL